MGKITVNTKGVLAVTFPKSKLIIGTPGWCAYDLTKYELRFPIVKAPAVTYLVVLGFVTAKLEPAHTLAEGCAATQTWLAGVIVESAEFTTLGAEEEG